MNLQQENIATPIQTKTNESAITKVFWIATFVFLTAIGAQIELPIYPVPFTLQTFFVLLSGVLLGKRGGAISMSIYVFFGTIGLPIFAGGSAGIVKILGPTGGYLLAFPIAAFIVGYLVSFKQSFIWIVFAVTIGSISIFLLGTIQLNYVLYHNWGSSLQAGLFIFSLWDVIKILGVASISSYYFKRIQSSKQ
jgi:biotin transport system substrate-specific component